MSPTTPGDPQKGKPDRERTELEAEQAKSAPEEAAPQPEAEPSAPGEPEAEGTAAEVTGVDKAGAAAAARAEQTPATTTGDDAALAEGEGADAPTGDASAGEAGRGGERSETADPDAGLDPTVEPPAGEDLADDADDDVDVEASDAGPASGDVAGAGPGAADAATEEGTAPEATEPSGRRRRRRSGQPAEEAPPAPQPTRRRDRPRDPDAPSVVVRAQARYVRTSARKARLVCDHIRGKDVQEARAILAFTPRAAAKPWSKLLESAIANAEANHELVGDDLRIVAVYADEGPTLKRFQPRAMGRATRIRKRTSHLTIQLTAKES